MVSATSLYKYSLLSTLSIVPHVGVLERDFVVIPLLDLDDHLQINGHSLRDLELLQQANLTVIADQSWANA